MNRSTYLLLSALFVLPFLASAQNVLVSPGAGSYPTLKAAFDAINTGTHTGAVVITIANHTTETATATLNASGTGAASYTSVAIGASSTVNVTGNIAGPLVNLNGADNVTINGLDAGGSTSLLSFINNSTSQNANTSTIRLVNDATNNAISYCMIMGSSPRPTNTTTATGTVLFGAGTTSGNSNNNISFNYISSMGSNLASRGIASFGSASAPNSNNTISMNLMADIFNATYSAAIFLDDNNKGWTIASNRIFQTAARTGSGTGIFYGIRVEGSATAENMTITGNVIGYGSAAGTGITQLVGSGLSFQGISLVLKPGSISSAITDNEISDIVISNTGSAVNYPISITVAAGGVPTAIVGNTIKNINSTGNIYALAFTGSGGNQQSLIRRNTIESLALTAAARFYGILYNGGNGGLTSVIDSNIVRGVSLTGTASGSATGSPALCCIYVASGSTMLTANKVGSQTAESISCVQSPGSTSSFDVLGIFVKGVDDQWISGNEVGGLVADNSASASGTGRMFGIRTSTTGVGFVDVNRVGGTVANSLFINSAFTGTSIWGIYNSAGIMSFRQNIIRNLSSGAGTGVGPNSSLLGICSVSPNSTAIDSNYILNLSSIGLSVAGIMITAGNNNSIQGNVLGDITGTGASGSPSVTGIALTGGTGSIVARNSIGGLSQTSGFINEGGVNGILAAADGNNLIYNNRIGALTAPSAISKDAIRGISISSANATGNYEIYYNTVHLSAASSGSHFGSTALFHTAYSNASGFTIKNNILSNTSTPAGDGATVALRRWSGDLTAVGMNNYNAASNNNLFYAGPPAANRLLYSDSVVAYQDWSTFKAAVAPRESNSIAEPAPILSSSPYSPDYLRIDPNVPTNIESGGTPVAAVTTDIAWMPRWGDAAYTGAGTAPDIGAFEGNYMFGALPVKWSDWKVVRKDNLNVVSWLTLGENNNSGFYIEKSVDGKAFKSIGFVASMAPGGTNTETILYQFTDKEATQAVSYYRIKQVDKDGKYNYSPVLSVGGLVTDELRFSAVYPNPVKDQLNVSLVSPANERMQLVLIDVMGRIAHQQAVTVQQGANGIVVDMSRLGSGRYIMKLYSEKGSNVVANVIKQ